MRTIVLENPGVLVRTETPPPADPGPGEALVAVRQAGICGSDLHAFRGRQPFFTYPRIPGHELGVEVVAVGEGVRNAKPGDRCAVEPYLNCGVCIACRRGRTNCCESLKVLGVHVDGGMRDRILVPASKLHVSATLGLEQLALVETLGIGAHAVDRANLEPGEAVLVIGAGPIGLSVVQFCLVAGARVVLLELNPGRMAFCGSHFRIEAGIGSLDRVADELREALSGDLPTAVFDATGSAASMRSAFQYVANGGRLVLVGLVQDDICFHDPEFHRRETTLFASRNALAKDFTRIIGLMESGRVKTGPWITHRAGFEELVAAFPGWLEPDRGVVKAMVSF
jgi:2-desacetyl-2-hydroxyethyl bacteriochlorophyllide A dehydrogenase